MSSSAPASQKTAASEQIVPGDRLAPRHGKRFARTRQSVAATSLSAQGEPMIWLTGGALAVAVIMIVGLLVLVIYQGMRTFWPLPVERVVTDSGAVYLGEVADTQSYVPSDAILGSLSPELAAEARERAAAGGALKRQNFRIENFELTNEHFVWIDEFRIKESTFPEWARGCRTVDQRQILRHAGGIPARRQAGCQHRRGGLGQIP